MCFIGRKIFWTTVILLGGGFFFFGRDLMSYIGTAVHHVKGVVKDNVPTEFEIARARDMVKDLSQDVRKNMQVIAKEEVEVERLDQQIKDAEEKLGKDRSDILRLKDDLAKGQAKYTYSGRVYTVSDVKADLSNRFDRFKTAEATFASLQEIRKARQASLDSARQKLDGMLASKRKLEVDVENLEARLKAVEVAQTTSQQQFDDSRLSRIKELVSDLRVRIDVDAKLVDTAAQITGQIPVDAKAQDNIADQITEYFSGGQQQVADNR